MESSGSVFSFAHAVDGARNYQYAAQYEYERPNVCRDVLTKELGYSQDDYEEPYYYAYDHSAVWQTEASFFRFTWSKAVVASLYPFNVKR